MIRVIVIGYVLVLSIGVIGVLAVFCLLAAGWQMVARWLARRRQVKRVIEALTS